MESGHPRDHLYRADPFIIALIEGRWDADYAGARQRSREELADELLNVLADGLPDGAPAWR